MFTDKKWRGEIHEKWRNMTPEEKQNSRRIGEIAVGTGKLEWKTIIRSLQTRKLNRAYIKTMNKHIFSGRLLFLQPFILSAR